MPLCTMGEVRVRRSRLPVIASVLMTLLGVATFVFVNHVAGALLFVLGLAMYFVYGRLASSSTRSAEAGD